MKYVRNTRSPSRKNTLWPCHSSTPKSLSKPSVMVYQGISQPIRAFRRSMAAWEQVEQAPLALRPVKLVLLLHGEPRHPPAFGGQRVTGAGQLFLLHEQLLARSLPLLLRHDRGCVHREMPFPVFLVSLFACCHLISPVFSETDREDSL